MPQQPAFPQLLEALETGKSLKKIPGLTYKKENDTIVDTGPAPFPKLDRIPLPCYEELPLSEAEYKHLSCETSRGCPKNCSFCGIYPHKNWRAYPPEKALAAMEHGYKYVKYGKIPYIFLTDSNFTVNVKRIQKMAELVEDKIPSYCPTRADDLNEKMIKNLQKIGLKMVFVGVESASEDTLANVNKKVDVNSVEHTCRNLIDHGIIPRLSFIFGLPGENIAGVISSLKYIKSMVELFGEDINVVIFPCRNDFASNFEKFKEFFSLETTTKFLMPDHTQGFKKWVSALVYLVNTYHNTLPPEEQIAVFDNLIKSSPKAVLELAKEYRGKQRPWLSGYQKYFQSDKQL